MRKVLLVVPALLSFSISLLVSTPGYTAGEVPTVEYPRTREACSATSTELIVTAPAAAAVSGRILEEGQAPASFSLAAGQTKRVAVSHGGPLCTSTNLPNRRFRVITSSGAAPFELTVAAESITLEASGAPSNAVVGVTKADVTLTCATGAVKGNIEVKTGDSPPNPAMVQHTVDSTTGRSALKHLESNQTVGTPFLSKPIANACTAAHTLSVGIEAPASSKGLTPSWVLYRKAPLSIGARAESSNVNSAR